MRCSAFHGQCESLFLAAKRRPSDVGEESFEVASFASSAHRRIQARGGGAAESLEARVRELEDELRRVERERDILKKALAVFGRNE